MMMDVVVGVGGWLGRGGCCGVVRAPPATPLLVLQPSPREIA